MKKLFAGILATVAALALCVMFAACGATDVSGKTYVFSHIEVSYSSDVSNDEKEYMEAFVEEMEETMKDITIEFMADGKVKLGESEGTWEQNGKTVKVTAAGTTQEGEASGDTFTASREEGGITMKLIYKIK